MYTEEVIETKGPKKMSKTVKIVIAVVTVLLIITGVVIYLSYKNAKEIEAKTPYIKIPTAYIVSDKWSNKELTVIVDENKKLISKYSFDGGKTWQKENTKSFTENQEIEVMVKDTKGLLSEKTKVKISKIDIIPPVINFEEITTIEQNTIFSLRSSVTVVDKESGVSKLYTIDPVSIDTAIIGTYTVTYTAEDIAGNITTKTRTINVVAPKEK